MSVARYVYSEEIILKIRLLYFHTRNQIYLNLFYHLRSRSYDTQIQTKAYRKLNFSYCYFLAFRYLAWWILIATLANTTLVQRYWNFFYTLQNIHTHSRRTWYRVVYDIRRWWNYLSNSEYLLICLYCTPIMRIIIWVISFRYATEEYDVVQLIHAP